MVSRIPLLRAAGVDMEAVAAACQPPADAGRVRFLTTLGGEELGSLPFERQGDEVLDVTPTPLRNLSQHHFERILRARLRAQPNVELRLAHEWESAEQDEHGVTSRLRDAGSGELVSVRSRWLLAADGAGSRVRKSLGIEPAGPARLASFVMIHLAADFRPLVADRPGVLYFLNDAEAKGVFVAHDVDAEWVYMQPWDPEAEPAAAYDAARCERIVRAANGAAAPPFRV